LLEDLGSPRRSGCSTEEAIRAYKDDYASSHYDYESEDQRPSYGRQKRAQYSASHPTYNSIDNIAEFFASKGKKFTRPKVEVPETTGRTGFRPGQRVRHPKYGEGTVHKREGDGEDAKLTVQFPRFGLKKLVEKYAQLERV
jgi:DNA helicase-2/ATP-dependent DNA helicase PcrA